ncbi:MerC domain-containing protein [Pseudomonadales bacterium]|nr:MerC domain-containing protein [Pseudomonadales bacterium]
MSVIATMDRSAVGLSVLCIAHCLIVPFVVTMVPSLAAYWFAGENLHLMLLYLVLPTTIVGIGLGCRRHRSYGILFLAVSGPLLLVFAFLFGHNLFGEAAERLLTVVGAGCVMIAHIQNFRLCRSCDCEH